MHYKDLVIDLPTVLCGVAFLLEVHKFWEESLNYLQVGMLIFQINLIGYLEIEIRNLLHY